MRVEGRAQDKRGSGFRVGFRVGGAVWGAQSSSKWWNFVAEQISRFPQHQRREKRDENSPFSVDKPPSTQEQQVRGTVRASAKAGQNGRGYSLLPLRSQQPFVGTEEGVCARRWLGSVVPQDTSSPSAHSPAALLRTCLLSAPLLEISPRC